MPDATRTVIESGFSIYLALYLLAGIASVAALAALLASIGRAARECPVSGPAAQTATLGVVGAFAAIGLGVVALIGAAATAIELEPVAATLAQYGATSVALGFSFAIAAASLREALSRAMRERLAATRIAASAATAG